jgi:hypothetical protein
VDTKKRKNSLCWDTLAISDAHISVKGNVLKHYAMKKYGGVEVQLHLLLSLHEMEVSGQLHDPAALFPG